MHHATYYEVIDPRALMQEFPIGAEFTSKFRGMSVQRLREHQNQLFARQIQRAWQLPFYQRLWGGAGIQPGDIRSVDDIARLPSFGKQDIMESIERRPPLGDHHGREIPIDGKIYPMILHATSGTTGRPQPLLFSPRAREVHKLMLARAYILQGLRPEDVVHSVYGHGPVNGGHYVREAVVHHTGATFVAAGTGVETPSLKQVEFMRDFHATVIVGFADYIKRLADVAHETGCVPGRDIHIRMISGHLAKDAREALAQAWGGPELFDWYGVGDTGLIAAEAPITTACTSWRTRTGSRSATSTPERSCRTAKPVTWSSPASLPTTSSRSSVSTPTTSRGCCPVPRRWSLAQEAYNRSLLPLY